MISEGTTLTTMCDRTRLLQHRVVHTILPILQRPMGHPWQAAPTALRIPTRMAALLCTESTSRTCRKITQVTHRRLRRPRPALPPLRSPASVVPDTHRVRPLHLQVRHRLAETIRQTM